MCVCALCVCACARVYTRVLLALCYVHVCACVWRSVTIVIFIMETCMCIIYYQKNQTDGHKNEGDFKNRYKQKDQCSFACILSVRGFVNRNVINVANEVEL